MAIKYMVCTLKNEGSITGYGLLNIPWRKAVSKVKLLSRVSVVEVMKQADVRTATWNAATKDFDEGAEVGTEGLDGHTYPRTHPNRVVWDNINALPSPYDIRAKAGIKSEV